MLSCQMMHNDPNGRVFSDVTEGPKLAGMTAHSERIQRMAPGDDITFEGHGALCVRRATKRPLLFDRPCPKLSFGTTFGKLQPQMCSGRHGVCFETFFSPGFLRSTLWNRAFLESTTTIL